MPIPKKVSKAPSEVPRGAAAARRRLPRRIVVFVVVRDESGSMQRWRQRQGEFLPAVTQSLVEAGGPRIAELIFVLYAVVSGGVVTTEFVPLSEAADPSFEADGQTPIGAALGTVSVRIDDFLSKDVFPAEASVKSLEVLVVSDLKATGETPEETEAGIQKFVGTARKYKANVTVVGPSREATDHAVAARLDLNEKGVKYLDTADPKSILKITFDSLLSASRALTGSKPPARIR